MWRSAGQLCPFGFKLKLNPQKVENPHRAGDFIAAPPLKNAIIMNVGDLIQRWSNGRHLIYFVRIPLFRFIFDYV